MTRYAVHFGDPAARCPYDFAEASLRGSAIELFDNIDYIRHQIREIDGIEKKPKRSFSPFAKRISEAIRLALTEKEILVFALLQWVSIGLGYQLWLVGLEMIPEHMWWQAAHSDNMSLADVLILSWAFLCVGIVSYPLGILSGCMGAAHFLHRQGRPSSIALCLKLVLPRSWGLWLFHWADGWITVTQILRRLPKKNDHTTPQQRALREAAYYAWKLGAAGMLPAILSGHDLGTSAVRSVDFVKAKFKQIAALRISYSSLCWVVGVSTYLIAASSVFMGEQITAGVEVNFRELAVFQWLIRPVMFASGLVIIVLRPVYLLALCDLYSEHVDDSSETLDLPQAPSRAFSAVIAFASLCAIVLIGLQVLGDPT